MITGIASPDSSQPIVTRVRPRPLPEPVAERTDPPRAPGNDTVTLTREYTLLQVAARDLDRLLPAFDRLATRVE